MTAAAPSGVVTFLFTDLEGSTSRWEKDANAMRRWPPMTRCCARRLRCTAAGCSSTPVTVYARRSPRRDLLWTLQWPRSGRWSCRCGWGWRPGKPSCALVMVSPARVMAAGHGGQILSAESTAGLLSGVDLVDLGPRRLRDLPTPVGVFQVRAPGLCTDFPPLRALDTSPGNLRSATSSFIGRESELDDVQATVKAHRLIALTSLGEANIPWWSVQRPIL
jgi:hypothetical protein